MIDKPEYVHFCDKCCSMLLKPVHMRIYILMWPLSVVEFVGLIPDSLQIHYITFPPSSSPTCATDQSEGDLGRKVVNVAWVLCKSLIMDVGETCRFFFFIQWLGLIIPFKCICPHYRCDLWPPWLFRWGSTSTTTTTSGGKVFCTIMTLAKYK